MNISFLNVENNTNKIILSNNEEIVSNNYSAIWKSQIWYSNDTFKFVNHHWLSFPPPTKVTHALFATLYILIMTIGVFGNLLVIFMFLKCRSLRSPANILVANLAVSDLGMMLKIPLFIYHTLQDGLPLGNIACKIYGCVGGLTGTVSICTLSCIALDRYYVIVYPLNRTMTKLRSKIGIIVSWIYGCLFSMLPLLHANFGGYVPEGFLTTCSFNYLTNDINVKYFITCYFFAAWVVPFLLITICYSKIIRVVILAKNIGGRMEDPTNSSRHCKEQEQKKKEIRLAFVILIVIGLWFIAWTPYAVVALLGIFDQKELITPLTSMIPALFCKSASCLDPFVYAVTNQKFKEELKLLIYKRRINRMKKSHTVWSTKESLEKCDNSIEEVFVTMNDTSTNKFKNLATETRNVKPVSTRNISAIGKQRRISWILRPNFSNRSTSLRKMARTWNRSKENSIEDNKA